MAGRKKKDTRLEELREKVLSKLTTEEDPQKLRDFLMFYKELGEFIESQKTLTKVILEAQRMAKKMFPIAQECSIEGCTELGERHHDDYTKPLDILWLCPRHHQKRHATLGK